MRPGRAARRLAARSAQGLRAAIARHALPRAPFFLRMRLDGSLPELSSRVRDRATPGSLLEALLALDAAARDPRVAGLLLELGSSPSGWSGVQSLRRALQALRARGKVVAVHAESLDASGLLLASAADRIWLPETGQLHLVGLRAESFYLHELLSRLGVRADVVRIGSHKTAAEVLTRSDMSPEQREQQEALLDDLFASLVEGVAAGRGLTPEAVRALVDRGPFVARAAQEAGLVDACLYPDQIDAALAELAPARSDGPRAAPRVDARVYAALRPRSTFQLGGSADPGLAYVVAEGAISRGSGLRGVSADTLRACLDGLREAPEVRGVALRIESPGGDALASDLLWRSVERLTREKPVVATLGDVAASGGYYLACAADAIFAESGSLTGSIGVVGGKLDLSHLYRQLGVGRDGVERGARAGMLSEARPLRADERSALRTGMAALYEAFVERVARGRHLAHDAVARAAEGRVWSGTRALEQGLVDALGGPLEALRELGRRAGLAAGESTALRVLPRTASFAGLRSLLHWLRV
ncbi:MAG TPA: signal peptide peptidase SppA [Myxococcota bacterium]|nr:signal peptide peptidase SppA [Myxococcota bacterium]